MLAPVRIDVLLRPVTTMFAEEKVVGAKNRSNVVSEMGCFLFTVHEPPCLSPFTMRPPPVKHPSSRIREKVPGGFLPPLKVVDGGRNPCSPMPHPSMDDVTVVAEELVPAVATALPEDTHSWLLLRSFILLGC